MYRVEWIRHQEREKKKLEDEKEKERGWFLLCTISWLLHVCFEYPCHTMFSTGNNETNVEIFVGIQIDSTTLYISFALNAFHISCNTFIVMADFYSTILLLGIFCCMCC